MKNKAFYLLAFILLVSFVYKSNSSSSSSSLQKKIILEINKIQIKYYKLINKQTSLIAGKLVL